MTALRQFHGSGEAGNSLYLSPGLSWPCRARRSCQDAHRSSGLGCQPRCLARQPCWAELALQRRRACGAPSVTVVLLNPQLLLLQHGLSRDGLGLAAGQVTPAGLAGGQPLGIIPLQRLGHAGLLVSQSFQPQPAEQQSSQQSTGVLPPHCSGLLSNSLVSARTPEGSKHLHFCVLHTEHMEKDDSVLSRSHPSDQTLWHPTDLLLQIQNASTHRNAAGKLTRGQELPRITKKYTP